MSRPRKTIPIDAVVSFNFENLINKIKKDIKIKYSKLSLKEKIKRYPDYVNKETSFHIPTKLLKKLMYEELQNFTLNNQTFEYTYTPTNYNGIRWFVRCPKCGVPYSKLFLPDKFKDREQRYLCRKCHNIVYISIMIGCTKLYKTVIKPLIKLERLKNKLKKMENRKRTNRNMWSKKYFAMQEEFNRLEKEINESPDYRLWKFSKEYTTASPKKNI
jgi:hypothetical protein